MHGERLKNIDNWFIQSIADPTNNFQNYRKIFQHSNERLRFAIPYLSLVSKDIYYNTTAVKDTAVDACKRAMLVQNHMQQIKSFDEIDSENLNMNILKRIYGLSVKHDDGEYS